MQHCSCIMRQNNCKCMSRYQNPRSFNFFLPEIEFQVKIAGIGSLRLHQKEQFNKNEMNETCLNIWMSMSMAMRDDFKKALHTSSSSSHIWIISKLISVEPGIWFHALKFQKFSNLQRFLIFNHRIPTDDENSPDEKIIIFIK